MTARTPTPGTTDSRVLWAGPRSRDGRARRGRRQSAALYDRWMGATQPAQSSESRDPWISVGPTDRGRRLSPRASSPFPLLLAPSLIHCPAFAFNRTRETTRQETAPPLRSLNTMTHGAVTRARRLLHFDSFHSRI